MSFNIFLVEDEYNFGSVLKAYLELNDFKVTWVDDGEFAVKEFKSGEYDICVLDVMLPNVDGFTIAKEIKKTDNNIPLIFLTAKSLKEDILEGFKIGADDYITKPFDTDVLLCKIQAILKRNDNNKKIQNEQKEFFIGRYLFNYDIRVLFYNKEEQKLSPKEAELLKMLCLYKNEVMPRSEALIKIWGEDNYFTTRSMDVFITKLRKYLKKDKTIEITNIHSSGYRLLIK